MIRTDRTLTWCAALLVVVGGLCSPVVAQRLVMRSWWDRAPVARSEHYVIKTDLPKDQARSYARHLDSVYEEFSRRLAGLPPRVPEKLNVYVFAERQDYIYTLRTRFGVNGEGTGGIFFVNELGDGLAFWTESLPRRRIEHVIQHEGFHQFAYSRFGGDLPHWVNEGLAEFFGEGVLVDDRLILGQSTPRVLSTVQTAVDANRHVPFTQMLNLTGRDWNERVRTGDADLMYEQAWSMVHFLVYGDGGKYQQPFERYLRLLNNGVASQDAFSQVFGTDTAAFETQWRKHALEATPGVFVTALERIQFLAEGALALSRQGTVPASIEELREQMLEVGFTQDVAHHGHVITLSAGDAENFALPAGGATGEPPRFAVTTPRLRGLTIRERNFEKVWPTPSAIRTEHVPRGDLEVQWIRDRESGEIRYEVVLLRGRR